jgi:very-short-patch-repair endonuclease
MTHLVMTAAQYRAHQERVKSVARKPRNSEASLALEPLEREAKVAQPDRWPLVLRDQIVDAGLLEPYREFTWHAQRNWRLDLAWPGLRLACEVDGMVHRIKGRFLADIERHNAMMAAGWRWIRVTPRMVETGEALALVRELLA